MSTQVGRISGPLLKANLLRNNVDLAFETDLLYIDAVNHRVGIKNSSPAKELHLNGSVVVNGLIIDNSITIGNVIISNNGYISTVVGPLNLYASSNIQANTLTGGHITFNDNQIYNSTPNEDLELRPNGTGILSLTNNVEINAGLHATGDITFDNNITIGDDSTQDTIVFNAKVDTSLIPTSTLSYSLGVSSRLWKNIYLNEVNNYSFLDASQDLIINGTSYGIIQGKIWYVAKNGSPTGAGNHPSSPFDSVQLAITRASAGDTIYIFPGTYYETFPLTVPAGVSIKGTNVKTCIINPSPSTTYNDAFLLNTNSSVSELTIQNFYFDSINNTGYAFRFAPGFNFNTKSPHVYNVSVITNGSITTMSDPIGFDAHDAGKGAYLDGSVANINSTEISMTMNNVTFITPGVDSITATNNTIITVTKVFTYFANKSYYATTGATIRSISSSSSYGSYSAHADGNGSYIILKDYDFFYVGTGKDSNNDHTLLAPNNGISQTNSGIVAYVGSNESSNFNVGSNFFIDAINQTTSINWASNNNINNFIAIDNSLTVYSVFNKSQITTGNLRFTGNSVEATSGDLNLQAFSGKTYLQQNVFANTNINVSNDFKIHGNVTVGNQPLDSVVITPKLDQDIIPDKNNLYNLGSSSTNEWWLTLWGQNLQASGINISNNDISATVTNSNLNFLKNGTGSIFIETLKFDTNVSNTNNIVLASGANSVKINSNTALLIPKEDSSLIPNPVSTGGLIFETDTKFFTGASTARLTLGGVYSADRLDRINLDGANQQIKFINNGNITNTITPTEVTSQAMKIGDITFLNNSFSTVNSNFTITGNGTGGVNFNDDIKFFTNTITNFTNSPLIVGETGTGYLKFDNRYGIVIPAGDTMQRQVVPQEGETRFNTDANYIEVFNGIDWTVCTGSNFATLEEIHDLADIYTLILG